MDFESKAVTESAVRDGAGRRVGPKAGARRPWATPSVSAEPFGAAEAADNGIGGDYGIYADS